MKHLLHTLPIVAATLGALSLTAAAGAAPLKGYSTHPVDYPVGIGMQKFADEIEKALPGKFEFKIYPSSTLGSENSAIDQTRFGVIDYAVLNTAPLSDTVDEFKFMMLPYIFKSPEHMYRVLDSELGDEIAALTEKHGMVTLGWMGGGARSFYTRDKAIETPDDLAGLKIRVQQTAIMVDTIEALGAKATPLPFTEVFTAIKTGVVDGAENNWPSYESTGHYEVAPYYSLDMHTIQPEVLVVSKKLWDRLSDAEKTVFKKAGKAGSAVQREEWAKREEKSREVVVKAGSKIIESDVAAFQKKVAPVWDKYLNPAVKPYVDRIQQID